MTVEKTRNDGTGLKHKRPPVGSGPARQRTRGELAARGSEPLVVETVVTAGGETGIKRSEIDDHRSRLSGQAARFGTSVPPDHLVERG